MIILLSSLILVLLLIFSYIVLYKGMYMRDCDGVIETTTICTSTVLQGNLSSYFDEKTGQRYVYDPVDHKLIWLNDSDDMYEDAKGLIWKVV